MVTPVKHYQRCQYHRWKAWIMTSLVNHNSEWQCTRVMMIGWTKSDLHWNQVTGSV